MIRPLRLLLLVFALLTLSTARAQNTSWDPPVVPPKGIEVQPWSRLKRLVDDGYAAERAGDWNSAYANFTEALSLAEPDRDSREFCLYRLVIACRHLNRGNEAQALSDRIMTMQRPDTIPADDWYTGLYCIQDAEEARYRYEFRDALRLWKQADTLLRPDPVVRTWTLHNIAFFQRRLGRWVDSYETCTALEPLLLQQNRRDEAAEMAEWRGVALVYLGQEAEAEPHLQRAWNFWKTANQIRYALSLINVSVALDAERPASDRGDALNQQGRSLLHSLDASWTFMPYHTADVHSLLRQGRYDRVINKFLAILKAPELGGVTDDRVMALNRLADAYMRLGDYEEALRWESSADELRKSLDPREGYYKKSLLDMQARVFLETGQWRKASATLEQVHTLLERMSRSPSGHVRLNGRSGLPGCMILIGQVAASRGAFDEAEAHYQEAIAILDAGGREYEFAVAVADLGDLYRFRGQWEKARDAYERAEARLPYVPVQDTWVEIPQLRDRLLASRADIAHRRGDLAKAEVLYRQLTGQMEDAAREATDPDAGGLLQRALVGGANQVYNDWADIRRDQRQPAAEGLALVERGRAQGLARRVAESNALVSRLLSPEDAAALRKARSELNSPYSTRVKPSVTVPSLNEPLVATNYTALRRKYAQQYPEFGRMCEPQPIHADALETLAKAHPDTLYLEWAMVDEKHTLLYALSAHTDIRCWSLPVGDLRLAEMVRAWRTAIQDNSIAGSVRESNCAQTLYSALFAPVVQSGLLNPKITPRLVLVGDGPLLELPFAALEYREGKQKHRLIEKFAISEALSLRVLTLPSGGREGAAIVPLLCVADPTGPNPTPSVRTAMRRRGYGPLHFARREAHHLSSLFSGSISLYGAAMTETALLKSVSSARILHFATHGFLDRTRGLNSWLLLAPEKPGAPAPTIGDDTNEVDGKLEAREVLGLSLSAELAVLSACESGGGQASGGDGLLGFAWAFRAAGCPAVVSSYWELDDAASARLMAVFYERLCAGDPKDVALQRAALAVRGAKDGRTRRPFFWAAFHLTGDSSSLRNLPPRRPASNPRVSRR